MPVLPSARYSMEPPATNWRAPRYTSCAPRTVCVLARFDLAGPVLHCSPPMKITDVTVTLFAWPDIPATTYGRHTGRFSGESQLGLVTLRTDEGLEGHAFLGSAMRG